MHQVGVARVERSENDGAHEVAIEVAVADLVVQHESRAVSEQLLLDQSLGVESFLLTDFFESAAVVDQVVGDAAEEQQFLLAPFACAVVGRRRIGRAFLLRIGAGGAGGAVFADDWPMSPRLSDSHQRERHRPRVSLVAGQRVGA